VGKENPINILLTFAIGSWQVNPSLKSPIDVEFLQDRGLITLFQESPNSVIISIPPILLNLYNEALDPIDRIFPSESFNPYDIHWSSFEALAHGYFLARLNSAIFMKKETIALGSLFKGGAADEGVMAKSFRLPSTILSTTRVSLEITSANVKRMKLGGDTRDEPVDLRNYPSGAYLAVEDQVAVDSMEVVNLDEERTVLFTQFKTFKLKKGEVKIGTLNQSSISGIITGKRKLDNVWTDAKPTKIFYALVSTKKPSPKLALASLLKGKSDIVVILAPTTGEWVLDTFLGHVYGNRLHLREEVDSSEEEFELL